MYPLKLMAQPGAWRIFSGRKADPKFAQFVEKVWQRDQYTCQYCGFSAQEYMEVVNIDQNYRNNKLSNLVTACPFCTQCFFIDAVGIGDFGGGTLIYLPEISQVEINSFCHILFCAVANNTDYKSTAQSIYRTMKFRSQIIEEEIGEGFSIPSHLGQLVIENNTSLEKLASVMEHVRLLPLRGRFRTQIQVWAQSSGQAILPPADKISQ